MVKTIAISVAVLSVLFVTVVLILAATKPDAFRVRRSTSIKAPPDKAFAFINDFQKWGAWSPYGKKNPAIAMRSTASARWGAAARFETRRTNIRCNHHFMTRRTS